MAKTAYPEQKNGAVKKPAVAATTAAAGFEENPVQTSIHSLAEHERFRRSGAAP